MKTLYREVAHPAFPYCRKHNRLYPHYTVGWLTPARPEELPTFQAQCDECRATSPRESERLVSNQRLMGA
jgi:hypothetical protein